MIREIEENALSDVVEFVKETISICNVNNKTPLFTQKSLTDMYNERIILHGASDEFAKRTQCIRLREKIMTRVPGLCSAMEGRKQ